MTNINKPQTVSAGPQVPEPSTMQQSSQQPIKIEPRSTLAAEEQYSTFTHQQKWLLVALVSVAATFSGFASNIYFPALPTISSDLGVSVTLVNLTVTSYMIFQGLAPPVWGAISDVRGRRPAYLCTFLVFLAACIGLANTKNYATLVVLRCLQSTGSASTIAIGSGVIGDITNRAERGGYMGIFQAGLLVPVAVGPVIGGALADTFGWRSVFWFLAIYSGAFLAVLFVGLPETLRSIVGNGSRRPESWLSSYPLSAYQQSQQLLNDSKSPTVPNKGKHIDLLAPFRTLVDQRAILIIGFLAIYYAVWQMSITAMSTLFESIYHLKETEIGLTYIANGVGSMIGTLTTGKLLDQDYKRTKASFEACHTGEGADDPKEFPIERARLRLVPILALVQCASILVFGWTLHYRVHIAAPIVSTFFTGWTAVSIQSAVMTYLVDIFPDNSASASAALNLARCLLGAAGTAAITPMIDGMTVGGCFSLLTGLMLLGLVVLGGQVWLRRRVGGQL